MKPALGTKIRSWNVHRNLKNGRPRRLKQAKTRSRSRPLECVAKKVLPLGIRRQGF